MRNCLLALLVSLSYGVPQLPESGYGEGCGKIPNPSIFHEGPAEPNELPWTTLLTAGSEPLCSGSLITKQHVLTSANCFKQWIDAVTFGGVDLQATVGSKCTKVPCEHAMPRRIENIYISQDGGQHDIAIVQLDKPAMDSGIWPICLPSKEDGIKLLQEESYVAGWGLDRNRADTTLHKHINSRTSLFVSARWEGGSIGIKGPVTYDVHRSPGDKAFCGSATGSGLYLKRARAAVFGVLSGGVDCDSGHHQEKQKDHYIQVSDKLAWIKAIIGGNVPANTIHMVYDRKDDYYKNKGYF